MSDEHQDEHQNERPDGMHRRGTAGGESFLLEIRALRSEVPVYVRLRGIIKRLLRSYQFRLTSISETTPKLPPPKPEPHENDGAGAVGDK